MSIEVRLLGRFTVLSDGVPIPAGAFRQRLVRTLLRILVCRRGEFISRDVLTEALWPNRSPADPGANLRVLVALARKALDDPSIIQSSAGGYAFSSGNECLVDAEIFLAKLQLAQDHLVGGNPTIALAEFRDALEHWGGEPLAEDLYEDWAQHYRMRLQRAHLDALEGATLSALAVGEPATAVAWAEQAAAQEPLRERSQALLVQALAVSGDTARALRIFEEFRLRLADELGLDVSETIQRLHLRVLRGELDRPVEPQPLPLPAELAVDTSAFVARSLELEEADKMAYADSDGRIAAMWILGEPGIGKTRLATEIACRIHGAGGTALFGRCSEDLDAPYQPFLQALQWYVEHVAESELPSGLGNSPGELTRLVPEISQRLRGLKPSPSGEATTEQYRLFEAVRSWLAGAAGGKPLVVVLDDLHWADSSTLALLAHIGRSAEPSATLLVSTARNTFPDEREAIGTLVEDLARHGTPTSRLELAGLDTDALAEMVTAATGRSLEGRLPVFVEELHAETAGNPFFVEALLKDLSTDLPIHAQTPASLRQTVERRASRLPDDVVRTLRTASVAGLEFDLRVIAQAARLDDHQALESLEAAENSALVIEQGPDRYRFRHGLVRSALRDRLSKSRRMRIHLGLGEAIEQLYGDKLGDHTDELAYHFGQAAALGGGPRAYMYTMAAGRRATDLLSHHQAVEAYCRALELLESFPRLDRLERYRALTALSEAQRRSGDVVASLQSLEAAADEAAGLEAFEQFAHAAISFEDTVFWLGIPEDRALELMRRAAGLLPEEDSALRAQVLAGLSRALTNSGQPEGTEIADEAVAMATRVGDAGVEFQVAFHTTRSVLGVQEAERGAARWTQLAKKAHQLGQNDAYLLGLMQTIWASIMLGDIGTADDIFAEYSRVATPLREPRWTYGLNNFAALRMLIDADLQEAEKLLRRAEQVGEHFGWAREGLYGVAMFTIRREQGLLSGLDLAARSAVGAIRAGGLWQPGLAALFAALGNLDDARIEYEAVLSAGVGAPSAGGTHDLELGLMAEVCGVLGDVPSAPVLLEALYPLRGKLLVGFLSAICLGPVDRLLGILACVAGRHSDAESWHRSGLELARRIDSPLWIAHCLYDYALHLGRAQPDDAAPLLAEAAALCDDHGLFGLRSCIATS